VLVDGIATLYLERGGHSLQTLPAFDNPDAAGPSLRALATLVGEGRDRELMITRIDGLPAGESPHRPTLEQSGFKAGYRGLVLRDLRAGVS